MSLLQPPLTGLCEKTRFPLFRQRVNEHGGTRTPDTQNRNLMLYPTELHAHFRLAPEV
jgi:hypothetical protein